MSSIYTLTVTPVEGKENSFEINVEPGGFKVPTQANQIYPVFYQCKGINWTYFQTPGYSRQFINLETGYTYNTGPTDNFYWAQEKINSSGTIIAVYGCYWGGNYEVKFFDISNLELESDTDKKGGIVEIKIVDLDENFATNDHESVEYNWIDDVTLEITQDAMWSRKFDKSYWQLTDEEIKEEDDDECYKRMFRLQLSYENGVMKYTLKESTPYYDELLRLYNIQREKRAVFDRDFPTNARYKQVKAAFPECRTFLFFHNGTHQDLESDIQDVHFGANIGKSELRSFKDKTLVNNVEFASLEDALASITL